MLGSPPCAVSKVALAGAVVRLIGIAEGLLAPPARSTSLRSVSAADSSDCHPGALLLGIAAISRIEILTLYKTLSLKGTTMPTDVQTVTLQGLADGKMLGDCSLSYAMGQLMVEVQRGGQAAGGMYAVDSLPIGEWFALADPRGFLLPVAIQRTRMDAYCVRMDPQPLQGLRTLAPQSGWVPSPHASPSPATAQQQRQNDQMAVRALQTGLNAGYQAAMNTANHLRY